MIRLAKEPDRWILAWARMSARAGHAAPELEAYWGGYWVGVTQRARELGIAVADLLARRRAGLDDETGKNH